MKKHSNHLIISGDGRNSGKTMLACRLIACYAEQGVMAVKICPHFHEISGMEVVHSVAGRYVICRETREGTGKDSSRMLEAGAVKVYYVQCGDADMADAWQHTETLLTGAGPVIIESGGMMRIVKPGLHVTVRGSLQQKPIAGTPDIVTDMKTMDTAINQIVFANGKWNLIKPV